SRLEKQPTDLRQHTSYLGDRTLGNDVLGFSGQDPSQVAGIGSAKRPIAPFGNQSNLIADLQAFYRAGADCRPIFEIRRGIDDQSSIFIFRPQPDPDVGGQTTQKDE